MAAFHRSCQQQGNCHTPQLTPEFLLAIGTPAEQRVGTAKPFEDSLVLSIQVIRWNSAFLCFGYLAWQDCHVMHAGALCTARLKTLLSASSIGFVPRQGPPQT